MSATDSDSADSADTADTAKRRPPLTAALALFGAAFLAMLDLSISMVALPAIRDDLHSSLSGLQWTVDAYTLCFAGLLLTGGLISDRLGHRVGLLSSLTLFTVGSVVCAIAPDTGTLIAGRAVQGAGAAMLVPSSMALIATLYPGAKERAKMLGLWSALSGVAIALGPVLGGVLVDLVSWRAIFAINLPLGIVAFLFAASSIPKVARRLTARLDVPGVVLGIVWSFALAFAIIEGAVEGWGSPLIVGGFVLAGVSLIAFLLVERGKEHAMLPLGLFRSRGFTSASVIAFALGFSLSTAFYLLSLHLQQVLGYSALKAGFGFLPAAVAMALTAPVGGRLAGKYGARPATVLGVLIGMVGLFSMSFVGPDTPFPMIAWMLLLIGCGLGMALPPNNHAALSAVPPERVGSASGTVQTMMQFGTVVGIAVLGAIQASVFRGDLLDRLTGDGVGDALARTAVDALASGRSEAVPGFSVEALASATAEAFAAGLSWAWTVAAAMALVAAVAALLISPRARPAAETSADEPRSDVGVL
ncbi:MFS transporter [Streptomyces sp. NPDC057638]|uniref:MFS transporter n=1 Tax=Streptomyces sp. NPDC057638 TaxID=3346190 RepID=UPI00367B5F42